MVLQTFYIVESVGMSVILVKLSQSSAFDLLHMTPMS